MKSAYSYAEQHEVCSFCLRTVPTIFHGYSSDGRRLALCGGCRDKIEARKPEWERVARAPIFCNRAQFADKVQKRIGKSIAVVVDASFGVPEPETSNRERAAMFQTARPRSRKNAKPVAQATPQRRGEVPRVSF